MGLAYSSKKQPQIVVNFCGCGHCGSWVATGALLVNGNRRSKTVDGIHRSFIHPPQKTPRVGGKRLHIAGLPLREKGVKGQTGFAGAGNACNHRHLIQRNVEVHVP